MGAQSYYCIAGHLICLRGEPLVNLVGLLNGFAPFAVANPEGTPVLTLTDDIACDMAEPDRQNVLYSFHSDDNDDILSIFGTTADGYIFSMDSAGERLMTLWCARGSDVMFIKGNLAPSPLSLRALRFTIWIAYGIAVSHRNTVFIHTSTITYQGRNVLFLGESGTGKSTHTRLWRENIAGATLLNDDSPIIRIVDGHTYVYGSPWSGKTPCYKNERYPLAACVRLSQAPYNKIRPLSVVEAFAAIHPSCPPDFAYDNYLYDGIAATLDHLLAEVPFYHLQCLPDADAARLSWQTVFHTVPQQAK